MDLNGEGLFRVAPEDGVAATKKTAENVRRGGFEEWPNEAGFTNLDEVRGPLELAVSGSFPPWAAGSLYRTGPGISEVETGSGTFRFSHWFDGLAHTHRFEIVSEPGAPTPSNGTQAGDKARVFYSSRRQSDRVAESIRANGSLKFITFAQKADPCVGFLGKMMSVFRREEGLDNVAVTVQPDLNIAGAVASNGTGKTVTDKDGANGKEATKTNGTKQYDIGHRAQAKNLYLATDTATMSRVDPSTLEPIGFTQQSELHPDLRGQMSAAHGKRDPVTGDFFNYNLELGPRPTYRIFQLVQETGEVRVLATIRGPPGYIHSFFLTGGYVVLCVNSLRHTYGGATIPVGGNVLDALRFEDAPCVWYVVDRKGGKGVVGEFRTPRGFFFHSTNAWDEEGGVVCEMVEYGNADILYSFYYDVMMNRGGEGEKFWKEKGGNIRLARYRFPLNEGKGERKGGQEVIEPFMVIHGPRAGELPTYNTRFATRPHRFVYGVASRGLSTLFDCIVKTDTTDGSAVLWRGPAGHTPGEPIFVARPVGGKRVACGVDRKGEEEHEEDMAEDDGVLLSVVLDGSSGESYLLCLDAGTLKEVGRAECGFAVGFGFHGRLVRA